MDGARDGRSPFIKFAIGKADARTIAAWGNINGYAIAVASNSTLKDRVKRFHGLHGIAGALHNAVRDVRALQHSGARSR
jgi:hypothetical protein